MTMFKQILKRQLIEDATSFRFFLYALLILAGLIAFPLIFADLHQDRVRAFSHHSIANDATLRSAAPSLVELIRISQTLLLEPRASRFIADGREEQMPRGLVATLGGIRLAAGQDDHGTAILNSPDLTSIVQIVFSFFALVLTFNAISSEKERGTLRLVLSNGIRRTEFLLAKYVGALIAAGIPFIVGLVLGLVLLSVKGVPVLSGSLVTVSVLFFILSLVYLSFFVLLGLLCSTVAGDSKASLVLCLLSWVLIVVILPKSAGPLLRLKAFSSPSGNAIAEEARLAGREVWGRYKGEDLTTGSPEAESTKRNVRVMNEAAQAEERIFDAHLDKKIRAVKTLTAATGISPASLFESAASAAAGTGLAHFERFRRQAAQYRNDLADFFRAQDAQDADSPHLCFHPDYVSKKPFDAAGLPAFREREPGLADRLKDAAGYGGGLILFNIVLFGLVFISFQRYDVR